METRGSQYRMGTERGFTLIELLIAVALLGVLASLAAPFMGDFVERQRLIGATQAVAEQAQLARNASIANNKQIYVAYASLGTSSWCAAISDTSGCDCKVADSCQVNGLSSRISNGTDFEGITVSTSPALSSLELWFKMPGNSALPDTLEIESVRLGDVEPDVKVVVSSTGRVRICSDTLINYTDYDADGDCP